VLEHALDAPDGDAKQQRNDRQHQHHFHKTEGAVPAAGSGRDGNFHGVKIGFV
jgi:hypothetical protein